jgi:hypothetical protein
MFMYLHRASWRSSATLTEGFPCFFLSCKANARVKPAKTGHSPHTSKIVVLFYVLFVLCCSVYCLCVNVYCTTATGCLCVNVYCTAAKGWLPNCSQQIYHYIIISNRTSQNVQELYKTTRSICTKTSLRPICSSSSSVICQMTGPKPLPKRFLHIVRSRASSFN